MGSLGRSDDSSSEGRFRIVSLEVLSEHLDLSDELVGGGLERRNDEEKGGKEGKEKVSSSSTIRFGPLSSHSKTSRTPDQAETEELDSGTYLDGHSSAVESHREERSTTLHSLVTSGELDLGDGEGVSEMKGSVHVGVAA